MAVGLLALLVGVLLALGAAPAVGALNVTTSEGLFEALEQSEPHIVITSHLDLRLAVDDTRYFTYSSGTVVPLGALEPTAYTNTIRGDCSGPVPWTLPGAPPLPLRPGQCMLLTSGTLLGEDTSTRPFSLWLDNLYLRLQRDASHVAKANYAAMFALFSSAERVWLTRSTVQGDATLGGGFAAFELTSGAGMFINDTLVTDVDLAGLGGGAFVVNATLSVDNTTFSGISVINVDGGYVMYLSGDTSAAMLVGDNVSFENNAVTDNLVRINETSVIYGNSSVTAVAEYLSGAPLPLELADEAPSGVFLAMDGDPEFAQIAEGVPPISTDPATPPSDDDIAPETAPMPTSPGPVTPNPSPPEDDDSSPPGGNGSSVGGVVGGVVGAVVLITVAVAATFVYIAMRQRRRMKEGGTMVAGRATATDSAMQAGSAYSAQQAPRSGYYGPMAGGAQQQAPWGPGAPPPLHPPGVSTPGSYMGYSSSAPSYAPSPVAPQWKAGSDWGSVMHSQPSTGPPMTRCEFTTTASGGRAGGTGGAPGGGRDAVEALETALDALHANRVPFIGRYIMRSAVERRAGGQGVVQFVSSAQDPSKEYAIKFYTNFDAFTRERALYMEPELRQMMPATHEIIGNEQGSLKMPGGFIFPPSIVIEKGESLEVWASREAHDFITIMQVLCHVAQRLHVLHAAGWAHRDIKPGNILRRPVQHSWTLIDFGCTARIGEMSPLSFSPGYAPPEVVAAYRAKQSTIFAHPAADMWALGVIAYEMVTRGRAFGKDASAEEMMARTAGEAPLPWEDPSPGAQAKLHELRGLKRAVLQCLSRNPAARPTSEHVLQSWNHMFDSTRTSMFTRYSDGSSGAGGSHYGAARPQPAASSPPVS